MFEGKPRNVWELGGGGCTQILRFAQDDMAGGVVVLSSWTERSAVKDLKGVSGCKQILRFAQDDRKGGVELLSSRTERSAVKDLGCIKGVLMWMYTWMYTRFSLRSTIRLPPFGRLNDRTGKGAWSVGQLVSFYARTYLCVVSWWNGVYVLIGW